MKEGAWTERALLGKNPRPKQNASTRSQAAKHSGEKGQGACNLKLPRAEDVAHAAYDFRLHKQGTF